MNFSSQINPIIVRIYPNNEKIENKIFYNERLRKFILKSIRNKNKKF